MHEYFQFWYFFLLIIHLCFYLSNSNMHLYKNILVYLLVYSILWLLIMRNVSAEILNSVPYAVSVPVYINIAN